MSKKDMNKQARILISLFFVSIVSIVFVSSSVIAWDSSLNDGLMAYYNFSSLVNSVNGKWNLTNNEGTGNISSDSGIIGGGFTASPNNNLKIPYDTLDGNMSFLMENKTTQNTGTVAFWYKIPVCTNYQEVFFSASEDGGEPAQSWTGVSCTSATVIMDSQVGSYMTTIAGVWRFVAFTTNSSGMSFYYNGTHKLTATTRNTHMTRNFYLGVHSNGQNDAGSVVIDEMGVWNRSLNAGEISTLYNSSLATTYVPTGGVSDSIYPVFSNFWDNNGTLLGSGLAKFNVSLLNTNGTVFLSINGTNFTAYNTTAWGVYNTSMTLINNSYAYYWWAYGNGTSKLFNSTQLFYYTINSSYDIIPPFISIVYPQNANYTTNVSTLNYTISTDASNCWYSTDGITNTTITCGTNATGLTSNEGWNNWTIWANDSASNVNYSSVTFFKDTINPTINFTYPSETNGSIFNRNSAWFNFSVIETNFANVTIFLMNSTGIVNQTLYKNSETTIEIPAEQLGNYRDGYVRDDGGSPLLDYAFLSIGDDTNWEYRSFIDFNTSIIPDSATINSIKLQAVMYGSGGQYSTHTIKFVGLNQTSNKFTGADLMTACGGGAGGSTFYNQSMNGFQGILANIASNVTFNSNATQNMNAQLTSDFFSICAYMVDAYLVSNADDVDIWSSESTTVSYRPKLIVTYTSSSNDYFTNFTNLADGTYFINATAYDISGNSNSTETRTITMDTINPTINFTYPSETNGSILARNSIWFNFSSTDANFANITITISNSSLLNSTIYTSGDFFTNFTNLADGTYFINATAYDIVGHKNSTETRTITLDTSPPIIIITTIPQVIEAGTGISIINTSCSDINGVNQMNYNITHPDGTIEMEMIGVVGYALEYPFSSDEIGYHNISVWCDDDAGNSNVSYSYVFVNDTTSPKFSNNYSTPSSPYTYSNTTNLKINVTWNDVNLDSNVLLSFNGTNYTMTGNGTEYYYEFSPVGAGIYKYYFFANDTSGNSNTSSIMLMNITKAGSILNLYLNNSKSNLSVQTNYSFWINASVNPTRGNILLFSNYSLINNGTNPSNYTNYSLNGLYNITAYYAGNANYSSNATILWVNVVSITLQEIEQPQAGGGGGGSVTYGTGLNSINLHYCNLTEGKSTLDISDILIKIKMENNITERWEIIQSYVTNWKKVCGIQSRLCNETYYYLVNNIGNNKSETSLTNGLIAKLTPKFNSKFDDVKELRSYINNYESTCKYFTSLRLPVKEITVPNLDFSTKFKAEECSPSLNSSIIGYPLDLSLPFFHINIGNSSCNFINTARWFLKFEKTDFGYEFVGFRFWMFLILIIGLIVWMAIR